MNLRIEYVFLKFMDLRIEYVFLSFIGFYWILAKMNVPGWFL